MGRSGPILHRSCSRGRRCCAQPADCCSRSRSFPLCRVRCSSCWGAARSLGAHFAQKRKTFAAAIAQQERELCKTPSDSASGNGARLWSAWTRFASRSARTSRNCLRRRSRTRCWIASAKCAARSQRRSASFCRACVCATICRAIRTHMRFACATNSPAKERCDSRK